MNALLLTIPTTCKWTQVYYWRKFCLFKELLYYYSITKSRRWKKMGHGQHAIYLLCIPSLKESVLCNRSFIASTQIRIFWNLRQCLQMVSRLPKKYVQVNGTASDKRIISHGVPQKNQVLMMKVKCFFMQTTLKCIALVQIWRYL